MSIKFYYERGAFEGWHDFHSVIVLDHSRISLDRIVRCLKNAGFSVQGFLVAEKALNYLQKHPGNLVIVHDQALSYRKGTLLEHFYPLPHDIPFIIMTQKGSIKEAVEYMKMGAIDVIALEENVMAYLPEVVSRSFKKLNTVTELERSKRALIDHEIELRKITENVDDIVIKTDLDGICTFVSAGYERVFHQSPREQLGDPLFKQIDHRDVDFVKHRVENVLQSGNTGKFEFRMQTHGNGAVWIEASGSMIDHQELREPELLFVMRDITHQKDMTMELEEERNFIKMVLDTVGNVVIVLDRTGRIIQSNKGCERVTGFNETELFHHKLWEALVLTDERRNVEILFQQLIELRQNREFECRIQTKNKWVKDLACAMTFMLDGSGHVEHILFTAMDITERKAYEREIKYMSLHDGLTGLYNRTFFEEELRRLDTARQLPLSIIVGDVNGLKLVNDAFGHLEGDKLLIGMSEILKKACRSEDIIARIGGDEFAIILPHTNEASVKVIMKRIRRHAAECKGSPFAMSIALGMGTKKTISESVIDVHKMADDRMYQNKLIESQSFKSSLIATLKSTLQKRTKKGNKDSDHMETMAERLGRRMGLSESQLDELKLLAFLHDIGKIAIPDQILNKPSALSMDEWKIIQKHPEIGYRIASTTPELSNIAEYILYHHERMDGKGYPRGLRGDEIPLIARALAVLDAYDAMVSERPYSTAMGITEALEEIRRCSGKQFDPNIAHQFVHMMMDFE